MIGSTQYVTYLLSWLSPCFSCDLSLCLFWTLRPHRTYLSQMVSAAVCSRVLTHHKYADAACLCLSCVPGLSLMPAHVPACRRPPAVCPTDTSSWAPVSMSAPRPVTALSLGGRAPGLLFNNWLLVQPIANGTYSEWSEQFGFCLVLFIAPPMALVRSFTIF